MFYTVINSLSPNHAHYTEAQGRSVFTDVLYGTFYLPDDVVWLFWPPI